MAFSCSVLYRSRAVNLSTGGSSPWWPSKAWPTMIGENLTPVERFLRWELQVCLVACRYPYTAMLLPPLHPWDGCWCCSLLFAWSPSFVYFYCIIVKESTGAVWLTILLDGAHCNWWVGVGRYTSPSTLAVFILPHSKRELVMLFSRHGGKSMCTPPFTLDVAHNSDAIRDRASWQWPYCHLVEAN